jgi:hypothetical protein
LEEVVIDNIFDRVERRLKIKNMKNIFKKISAVAASALMVGMTMGVAAAANYPSPFVSGGVADVAIVYGTGAGVNPSDLVQAGFIQTNLASSVTATGGTPTGDSILLEKSTNKFNMKNNMSSFYSTIDESELTTILAKGTYTNDVHDDFKYEQEVVLGQGLNLQHFLDSKFNDDQPVVGFNEASGTHLMNYTLKFTPDDAEGTDSSWTGITDSNLPLFGKMFYVLAMSNSSPTNHKITLLNSASSATLNQGETATLDTGTGSYTVTVNYIDTANVRLNINGEVSDSLIAGQTQKLSDGSYVGIKDVKSQQYAGGVSYVEFSIGSGKLVLENEQEVEINSEKLSKTNYAMPGTDETVSYKVTSYIKTAGNNIDNIVLDWETDDEIWLTSGGELVFPGFETIKLSMNNFVTATPEVIKLNGDSSTLEIVTTITDGSVTLPLFYVNDTTNGILGMGKDATHKLVSGNSTKGDSTTAIQLDLNETQNNFFVVSWISGDDYESYAFELGSVDEDDSNKTVLTNLVTGGTDVTLDQVGDDETVGNVQFVLSFAEEKLKTDEFITLNITAASTGSVYLNKLVTANGLLMTLPVLNNTAENAYMDDEGITGDEIATGLINISAAGALGDALNPTSWTMNLTEEDKDGNIGSGDSFTVQFGFSSTDGLEPQTIGDGLTTASGMLETADGSKIYEGYMPTDLATYLYQSKPSSGLNDLRIDYFGEESYAQVYVTEASSTMSGATGSLGNVLVKDSEVSSVSSKNLVVIGGSCINSAAATLVGGAKCTADFTSSTGIGSGQFLIQSFGNAYTTGKIALLVAGYEAADTINAVTYLKTKTVDTTAGKKYKGTSSSSATLVVE